LKNPAFQGLAAFGKTRLGEPRRQLRPHRNRTARSRRTYSVYDMPSEEQTVIPVPPIVTSELFATVQQQLTENRHRSRERRRGAKYLLQGLLECGCCGYAYYGKRVSKSAAKGKTPYAYYRCVGTDAYRFGGQRVCQNKQLRTDLVDAAVWEDVRTLLADPTTMRQEFERRLQSTNQPSVDEQRLARQMQGVQRSISRLIDAYTEGLLEKSEFEPRIHQAKQRLECLQATTAQAAHDQAQRQELQQVVRHLEQFAQQVQHGLKEADWNTRREIIRALVKSVKVESQQVRITYRISYRPFDRGPFGGQSLPNCWRSDHSALRRSLLRSGGLRMARVVGFDDGSVQPSLDEGQDRAVHHPHTQALEQLIVWNRVEVTLQVSIVHFPPSGLEMSPDLSQRIMRRPARTKPVRAVDEIRLEDRLQNQQHGHLHDPILDGWNAQWSLPSIRLGNVDTFDRLRPIAASAKFFVQLLEKGRRARSINDGLARLAVHASSAVVLPHQPPGSRQHVVPSDPVV
jgi:hypothetical protein